MLSEELATLQRRGAGLERQLGSLEAVQRSVESARTGTERDVATIQARLDAAEEAAASTYGQVTITVTLTLSLTLIGIHIWPGGGAAGAHCGRAREATG